MNTLPVSESRRACAMCAQKIRHVHKPTRNQVRRRLELTDIEAARGGSFDMHADKPEPIQFDERRDDAVTGVGSVSFAAAASDFSPRVGEHMEATPSSMTMRLRREGIAKLKASDLGEDVRLEAEKIRLAVRGLSAGIKAAIASLQSYVDNSLAPIEEAIERVFPEMPTEPGSHVAFEEPAADEASLVDKEQI